MLLLHLASIRLAEQQEKNKGEPEASSSVAAQAPEAAPARDSMDHSEMKAKLMSSDAWNKGAPAAFENPHMEDGTYETFKEFSDRAPPVTGSTEKARNPATSQVTAATEEGSE